MSAHIWVDAENINPAVFQLAYHKINMQTNIVHCDIYGKKNQIPRLYDQFTGNKFKRHNVFFGKNSADTFMCTDIVKACYEEPITDTFVIITEDKDFSCAIKVLTDNGKDVILVTEKDRCIHNLKAVGVNLNRVHNMEIEVEHKVKIEDKVEPMCTCFFKVTDGIKEVPFYNGIELQEFGKILSDFNLRRYYGKNRRLYTICEDNLLKVENGRVYFRKEYEYAD